MTIIRFAAPAALFVTTFALAGCIMAPPGGDYRSAVDTCLQADLEALAPTASPEPGEDPEALTGLITDLYGDAFEVSEDGETLQVAPGTGFNTLLMSESIQCVLGKLEAPSSLWPRMQGTRAPDGTQSVDWDGHAATWTYHPDLGLNVVISRE